MTSSSKIIATAARTSLSNPCISNIPLLQTTSAPLLLQTARRTPPIAAGLTPFAPTNAHGAGFQHGYAPPRALAHADDAYKRGSDSAIEAKLREKLAASQRQHNVSARAQSLDLTSLGMTSRGLGGSGAGLGETTIDEGGAEADGRESDFESSPPISAMMPTFPSLSDMPLGHLMGSTKPRQRNLSAIDPRTGRPVLDTDAVTTNNMNSMFASMNLDSPIR